jgi:phosphatidylglycerol:prolipoprotein diacylglycerol transferase
MTTYWVHDLDPVLLHIGPLAIRWYGVMYVLGLLIAVWWLGKRQEKGLFALPKKENIQDMAFYGFLGILIGGRLGNCFLYNAPYFLTHPLDIIKVWEGGMSFHGGMLGAAAGLWLYSRKVKVPFMHLLDNTALVSTVGLGLGRLANFINGELHGKVTEVRWAVIFPQVDNLPRHPVQLYQAFTDGVVLLLIMWFFSREPRRNGFLSGVFGVSYGILRIMTEPFRAEDSVLAGFLGLTKGQIYSVLTLLAGIALLVWSARQPVIKREEE